MSTSDKHMWKPIKIAAGDTPIARIRAAKRWTLAQMASKFHVSHTTILQWERGVMEPSGLAKILLEMYLAELEAG